MPSCHADFQYLGVQSTVQQLTLQSCLQGTVANNDDNEAIIIESSTRKLWSVVPGSRRWPCAAFLPSAGTAAETVATPGAGLQHVPR
jgi:hypothetical protein